MEKEKKDFFLIFYALYFYSFCSLVLNGSLCTWSREFKRAKRLLLFLSRPLKLKRTHFVHHSWRKYIIKLWSMFIFKVLRTDRRKMKNFGIGPETTQMPYWSVRPCSCLDS